MLSRTGVETSIPFVMILSLLIVSIASSHLQFEIAFANSSDFLIDKSFFTNSKPFISLADSSIVNDNKTNNTNQNNNNSNNTSNTIKALISSGDKLNNNYTFANVPDGLGAVQI